MSFGMALWNLENWHSGALWTHHSSWFSLGQTQKASLGHICHPGSSVQNPTAKWGNCKDKHSCIRTCYSSNHYTKKKMENVISSLIPSISSLCNSDLLPQSAPEGALGLWLSLSLNSHSAPLNARRLCLFRSNPLSPRCCSGPQGLSGAQWLGLSIPEHVWAPKINQGLQQMRSFWVQPWAHPQVWQPSLKAAGISNTLDLTRLWEQFNHFNQGIQNVLRYGIIPFIL